MYYIIVSRHETFYRKPEYGHIFTQNGGMQHRHDRWIIQTFDDLKKAKEALQRINEWYKIDGHKHEWHDTNGVYCLTGEGKMVEFFKNNEHITYLAFIDDEF